MKILFFGTPEFSAGFLRFLARETEHEVLGAVTQPDRPAGRGRHLQAPPVKQAALELGLPVLQPEDLKSPEFEAELRAVGADLFVVIAFSILPKNVLAVPRFGSLNLHGSLLPRYRGAAPVQWAVANGETVSGVTLFRLDPRMDHGPVVRRVELPIGEDETAVELFDRMLEAGRPALAEAISALERGEPPLEQDHSQATKAPKLKKEDGLLDWNRPAREIHNLVRGLQPWPGAWTALDGKTLRVRATKLSDGGPEDGAEPGTLRGTEGGKRLWAKCGDRWIELLRLQPQDKREMLAKEFWCGLRTKENLKLG